MHELIPITGLALAGALLFLGYFIRRQEKSAITTLLQAGLIVSGADFIVEFLGTFTGGWTYQYSWFFLLGTIPIELPVLFFSSGVWLGAAYLFILKEDRLTEISLDRFFLTITTLTLALYLYTLGSNQPLRMIIFTLPFGFWGYSQLKTEPQKVGACLLACVTALADWLIETWAVSQGNYSYQEGFTVETPLTYALLTLGFLGILHRTPKPELTQST